MEAIKQLDEIMAAFNALADETIRQADALQAYLRQTGGEAA